MMERGFLRNKYIGIVVITPYKSRDLHAITKPKRMIHHQNVRAFTPEISDYDCAVIDIKNQYR